jgi:hypothetical protein
MPTRNDIIAMAHRLLGVLAVDEVPSADQNAFAVDVLDGIDAELSASQGLVIPWDLDSTPNRALLGLSQVLASDLATHYNVSYARRAAGIMRLRAALISDDRDDALDYADGFVIPQGETATIAYELYPSSTDLTASTVTFSMRDQSGRVVISGASANVLVATGTPTVSYDFTAANTRIVGRYFADFTVSSGGEGVTFPQIDKIRVFVVDSMGGQKDNIDQPGSYF